MNELEDLIRSYLESGNILNGNLEDFRLQMEYYEGLSSAQDAIDYACMGLYKKRNRSGRYLTFFSSHFRHHYHEKIHALYSAKNHILSLAKYSEEGLNDFNSFHNLYEALGEDIRPIDEIGPLMQYDIGLRIGAYKNLRPTRLYVQRGALRGLQALYRNVDLGNSFIMRYRELQEGFPAFNLLEEAREAENFLCVFENELGNLSL